MSRTYLILAIEVVDVRCIISKPIDIGYTYWTFNYVEQRGTKKMKTFADIPFKETTMPKGIQALLSFGGEYELSIVKNESSYGNAKDLYEIAVFKDNDQVELPGITQEGDTVKGFLTKDEVVGIIKKMHLITGADPEAF